MLSPNARDHSSNVLIGEDLPVVGDRHQAPVHFDQFVAFQLEAEIGAPALDGMARIVLGR